MVAKPQQCYLYLFYKHCVEMSLPCIKLIWQRANLEILFPINFFDGFILSWWLWKNLALLSNRQLWATLAICINPKWWCEQHIQDSVGHAGHQPALSRAVCTVGGWELFLYITVIGLHDPILREIDSHPPSKFLELLSTNGWLVDIYSFFEFLQNTTF